MVVFHSIFRQPVLMQRSFSPIYSVSSRTSSSTFHRVRTRAIGNSSDERQRSSGEILPSEVKMDGPRTHSAGLTCRGCSAVDFFGTDLLFKHLDFVAELGSPSWYADRPAAAIDIVAVYRSGYQIRSSEAVTFTPAVTKQVSAFLLSRSPALSPDSKSFSSLSAV